VFGLDPNVHTSLRSACTLAPRIERRSSPRSLRPDFGVSRVVHLQGRYLGGNEQGAGPLQRHSFFVCIRRPASLNTWSALNAT